MSRYRDALIVIKARLEETGHCLCGHGESCGVCSPDPRLKDIRDMVNMALGDKMPDCDCDHNETCDICNPPYQEPIFFGCRNEDKGHYSWGPGFKRVQLRPPLDSETLDGLERYVRDLEQGVAQLIHIGNRYTVLGWKDNSVDPRGGSHAEFIFEGHLGYHEAMGLAKHHFPEVFARFKYPITRQGA